MLSKIQVDFILFIFIFNLINNGCRSIEDEVKRKKLICSNGFVAIGKHCYYFSNYTTNWDAAHYDCIARNASLASIKTAKENFAIKKYLTYKLKENGERWLDGRFNFKTQEWIWAAPGEKITLQDFLITPHLRDKWSCMTFDPNSDKWNARNCFESKQYICQSIVDVFIEVEMKIHYKKRFNISKCADTRKLKDWEKRKCKKLLGNEDNYQENMKSNQRNESSSNNEVAPGFLVERNVNSIRQPTSSAPSVEKIYICPRNMITLGNKCYTFSTDKADFYNAHQNCKKNNQKLAIVKSRRQDRLLRIFLNSNFVPSRERWIGGIYDWKKKQWKWARTGQLIRYKGFLKDILNRKSKSLAWSAIIYDPSVENQWNIRNAWEEKFYICQVKAKTVANYGPTNASANVVLRTG